MKDWSYKVYAKRAALENERKRYLKALEKVRPTWKETCLQYVPKWLQVCALYVPPKWWRKMWVAFCEWMPPEKYVRWALELKVHRAVHLVLIMPLHFVGIAAKFITLDIPIRIRQAMMTLGIGQHFERLPNANNRAKYVITHWGKKIHEKEIDY
jgi:hypothetical protein